MKNYFAGIVSGEIRCNYCAGHALEASITNFPNAKRHIGAQDTYVLMSAVEVIEFRSEFDFVCNCEMAA